MQEIQYMFLIYNAEGAEPAAGSPEFDQMMQGYRAFTEEVRNAGIMREGAPLEPVDTARRRAIDRIRRSANFEAKRGQYEVLLSLEGEPEDGEADQPIPDERLKLAVESYRRAMHLTENEVEGAHLEARLAAFEGGGA